MFLLQLADPGVTMGGVKINELIVAGEWWRFLTPAFLHGSPLHLAVNMLSLHQLGPVVEWTCGRPRFAAIYLLAAVGGNVLSFFGDDNPALGASGARSAGRARPLVLLRSCPLCCRVMGNSIDAAAAQPERRHSDLICVFWLGLRGKHTHLQRPMDKRSRLKVTLLPAGAIFGLAGALVVYFSRNRRLFGPRFDDLQRRLGLIIVLNFGTGLVLPQIDEW